VHSRSQQHDQPCQDPRFAVRCCCDDCTVLLVVVAYVQASRGRASVPHSFARKGSEKVSDDDKTTPKALQASAAVRQSGTLGRSDSGFSRCSDEHKRILTKGIVRSLKHACEGYCVRSCRPLLLRTQRQSQTRREEQEKACRDRKGAAARQSGALCWSAYRARTTL